MPGLSKVLSSALPTLNRTVLLLSLAASSAALAQSPACDRYRAELASLDRSNASARSLESAAQRQRNEIERLAAYYRSIGCDQGGLFFRPPMECGPIADRIRGLQATYQSLASKAYDDPSAHDDRRRQLRAAINKACTASTDTDKLQEADSKTKFEGGGRLVCVRSCDGGYFPLEAQPKGKVSLSSMCSALCPNAEVTVFRTPADGNIEEAVSETGQPYMKLPNALRYRKTYDSSCGCKKAEDNWAGTLQKAEKMIERRKGDVLVTPQLSEQMFNAMLKRPKVKKEKAGEMEIAKRAQPTSSQNEPEVTGSTNTTAADSERGKPRVIAPDIIPVPKP
jgi:hypothetical protein